MTLTLKAEGRQGKTKSDLRQLRDSGKVPGVVYGKNIGSALSIAVDAKQLLALLRANPHAVVELDTPVNGTQPVMMSDVQRDPLSGHLLHIDFHQIDMTTAVKTQVRLEFTGSSPGEAEGGILQPMVHELDIQCLPADIPDVLTVDISHLQMGESLLVSELTVPNTITVKSDPSQVVVTILTPQKDLTEEEAEDSAVANAEAEERAHEAKVDEFAATE